MYLTGNKKMLNMLILEILETYSDENHTLTQQEIIRLLKQDYGMECDRRSVKANVLSLIELGYEIDMEDGYFLINRKFDDAELRMLIDSVLFSKTLSGNQAKELVKKLESMGNKFFESKVSHVSTTPSLKRTDNKQVLYTVSAINDAIDQKKKISFKYNDYGLDFKLHQREKEYIVNPYQMVAANGNYYLLGNYDKYGDISYYRIDKITDVLILDEKVKPMKQVEGLEHGLDLPKHMAEHVYMFSGPAVPIKVRCDYQTIDTLIEWFGKDIRILEKNEEKNEILVRLNCNENAMFYWALQYGPYVEVVEPASLRNRIRESLDNIRTKYND